MDRIIYTAMSGARQTMDNQAVITNNLSNASTSGFRAQLMAMRAVPAQGAGPLETRVSTAATVTGVDWTPGPVNATGRELDVAMRGNAWLAVQDPTGNEAYTRRGDLRVDGNGLLLSGSQPVIGDGGPVVVPLGARVHIGSDGTISARADGQEADEVVQIGRLKLVEPGEQQLERGDDGLFRLPPGPDGLAAALPRADDARLSTGALEGSNVSAVESMVAMIDNARRYDMQMKVIKSADENAQKGNQLLSLQG